MSISIDEYNKLLLENTNLKIINEELVNKLKNYTNSEGHKKYYENNKDIVKDNAKKYLKKIKENNPEKIKEYARRAYLKKKEKLKINSENI
jgi:hypothetical protein